MDIEWNDDEFIAGMIAATILFLIGVLIYMAINDPVAAMRIVAIGIGAPAGVASIFVLGNLSIKLANNFQERVSSDG